MRDESGPSDPKWKCEGCEASYGKNATWKMVTNWKINGRSKLCQGCSNLHARYHGKYPWFDRKNYRIARRG